jgi:hypothetical protein
MAQATTTGTTPVAAEIDRIVGKAVDGGIALANLVESLKEVYQPNGEAIFRPAPDTLETLRLLKGTLNRAIETVEAIR